MKPISNETRMKIIHHKNNGETEANIAKWLFISKSSVTKIWSRFQKTGNILPDTHKCGRKPKVTEADMDKVIEKLKEQSDMTQEELIAELELGVTKSCLSKRLKKRRITYKKNDTSKKSGT